MPELPEVETIARTLEPLIRGATFTGARVLLPRSLSAGSLPLEQLDGHPVGGVTRRGKLVLIALAPRPSRLTQPDDTSPHCLAVHLKMTGRLFVHPGNAVPGPHTRVIFSLRAADGECRQLFFDDARTFGFVRLLSPASLADWAFWRTLGPEPLETPPAELARRLRAHNRAIKAVLLDQHVVAGVGNIYADEALFRAGLDPRTPAGHIPARRAQSLCRRLCEVLREAIAQCGSSIRDYRTARGDAGAFQNSFRVYGRAGEPCLACATPLARARVAGRATVYCPRCQERLGGAE